MHPLTLPRPAPPLGLAWSVWCVVAAWGLQGTALLVAGVTTQTAAGSKGVVGGAMVSSEIGQPVAIGLVALGIASYVGCVLVAAAQTYAQSALCTVGIIGIVWCALVAPGVALMVLAAMVAAVVLGVATDALDHLHPGSIRTASDAHE